MIILHTVARFFQTYLCSIRRAKDPAFCQISYFFNQRPEGQTALKAAHILQLRDTLWKSLLSMSIFSWKNTFVD